MKPATTILSSCCGICGARPCHRFSSHRAYCALLLLLVPAASCVQPHHLREFAVPLRCLQFTADSFTGPCRERPDGKIVCDKVVVTATCMKANPPQ